MSINSAVIIHGDKTNSEKANEFYKAIELVLKELEIKNVSHDEGKDFTVPKKADLWLAHSKGEDRFRFAPKGTILLGIGTKFEPNINHPKDHCFSRYCRYYKYHYTFTKNMKHRLTDFVKNN